MMSTTTARTLLAATLTALLCLPAQAEITVGVSVALSGPAASLGVPAKNALALWPQEIAGEKLRIMLLDDAADPTAAVRNARRFAEEKADVMVGTANTPSTIAMAQVAQELQIPQLTPAPAELPEGKDAWTFRMAMHAAFYTEGLIEHMKRAGVKTLGFLGLSDAYGELYLQAFQKQAAAAGITVGPVERFGRGDTSVAAQALRIAVAKPDAVLVVAVGGGAALPQKALKERSYAGKVYHTPASISTDFVKIAGGDAERVLVISGPEQVAEQLPANHPAKAVAMQFVEQYERRYGPGSRTQFAAHIYDFGQVLQKAVPIALKKAKPGTPEFRIALKDALETSGPVATSKGLLHYTATDHWGHGPDARVMLTLQSGEWKLLPR